MHVCKAHNKQSNKTNNYNSAKPSNLSTAVFKTWCTTGFMQVHKYVFMVCIVNCYVGINNPFVYTSNLLSSLKTGTLWRILGAMPQKDYFTIINYHYYVALTYSLEKVFSITLVDFFPTIDIHS